MGRPPDGPGGRASPPARPWRWLALAAGLAILLAGGAALLLAPRFVDWQAERPRVAYVLSALTGFEIEIGGDLDLRILPAPRIVATDVRIAGAQGRGAMSVARLDARVRVLPLLAGQLDLADLRLVRPVLRLDAVAVPRRLGPEVLPVALSDVLIEDGRIEVAGAGEGAESIHVPVGTVETMPETGLVRLTGEVRIGGHPGSAVLEATVRAGAREVPVRGTLDIPGAGAEATFGGAIAHDGVRGRLSMRGALAADGAGLPLSLAATLEPARDGHALRDVEVTVDGQVLRGEGRFAGGAAPGVTLALTTLRFDARALPAALEGLEDTLAGLAGAVPVSLAVEAARVVVADGTLRDVDVRAQVRDGRVLVRQARAVLPGDARLDLSGHLAPGEGGLGFSGDGDLQVMRLRETLAWAGVPLPQVAGDRLRTLSVRFTLDLRPGEVRVDSVSGRLDGIAVAGEAQRVRDGDGCRIAGRLSLAELPLDAYGLAHWPAENEAWTAPFRACPLTLAVAAGEVRRGAQAAQGVEADLALEGAALLLDVSRADLAGGGAARARIAAAEGRLDRLTARISTPDLAADAGALGLDVPGWVGPDVPADIEVSLDAGGALSVSGTAEGAGVEAVGQVADGRVGALSLTLDGLAGTQALRLLDAAGLGDLAPLLPGTRDARHTASAAWDAGGRLDLRLSGPDFTVNVAGEGGVDPAGGRLLAERADIAAEGAADGMGGAWRVAGVLTRGEDHARLGQARIAFGQSAVTGTATLARGELTLALDGGSVTEADARGLLGHLPLLLGGIERLPYAALHLEGRLDALTLAGMDLREVALDADLTDRGLSLQRLAARGAAGGRLDVSGGLVPGAGEDGPVARIAMDLRDIPLRGVLARLVPLDLDAAGDLAGEVTGFLTAEGTLSAPTGEVRLDAGAGRLTGLGTLPAIAAPFVEGDALAFDALSGEVSLAGARLLLRDLAVRRDGASARMTALLDPETGALRGAVEVRDAGGRVERAPLDAAGR